MINGCRPISKPPGRYSGCLAGHQEERFRVRQEGLAGDAVQRPGVRCFAGVRSRAGKNQLMGRCPGRETDPADCRRRFRQRGVDYTMWGIV